MISGEHGLKPSENFNIKLAWMALLKGLAQAKILKKSVILFWVLNMTIWCKHVQRLELQFFLFFVLRITSWARYKDEIPDY